MDFHHVTVMLQEAIEFLAIKPGGVYVDCTLGGGGHSSEILKALQGSGELISFDQDPKAIEAAGKRLSAIAPNFTLINKNFSYLGEELKPRYPQGVKGILFDIGVSSPQLDEGERGFSYMQDAPLDMRMDPRAEVTAARLVNTLSEVELTKIIWDYGEERWAKRIAQFIVERRKGGNLTTTGELVDVIKAAIPAGARREGPHPAKRTFQALRIAVNDELGVFARALDSAVDCLAPGGRLVVITFHSLEDRIAKEKFQGWTGRCTCPPEIPVCVCKPEAKVKLLTRKPLAPSPGELVNNPRARSAKLRAVERI
ncbi:MAG TPA: 16S rRNA (cytosine(1402)-N(4))-methyltransferase RsmH [Verrucomicrobiae bacterium]|nr:16S rRNA (cytosine(1402)-N(4))-methyltransferase RsmH [Verrucomicrobiae bacterium]